MAFLNIVTDSYNKITDSLISIEFVLETDEFERKLASVYSYSGSLRPEMNHTTARLQDIASDVVLVQGELTPPESILSYFMLEEDKFFKEFGRYPNLYPEDVLYLLAGMGDEVKEIEDKSEINTIGTIEIKHPEQLERLIDLTAGIFNGYKIGRSPPDQLQRPL